MWSKMYAVPKGHGISNKQQSVRFLNENAYGCTHLHKTFFLFLSNAPVEESKMARFSIFPKAKLCVSLFNTVSQNPPQRVYCLESNYFIDKVTQ